MSLVNTLGHLVNHPLNKSNKMAAIVRFLKWQIGSRLVPGEVIYKWVNDSRIVARAGETGVTGNIYCGLHEFPDMAFLLHVLRESDLFVDIGANVGSYTILVPYSVKLIKKNKKMKKVLIIRMNKYLQGTYLRFIALASSAIGARGYCFESVPSTYDRLMTNIRLNDLEERVISLNIALGNLKGEINFSSDQNCMNHVIADDENTKSKIIVNVSTLDEELKDAPFLMKIDVEGYETPALEGAKSTLVSIHDRNSLKLNKKV